MFDDCDRRSVVKHEDFKIGLEFWMSEVRWRVTDIGTRTVIAINIDAHEKDQSWFDGPPYEVVEVVLDEYDLPVCSLEESTE